MLLRANFQSLGVMKSNYTKGYYGRKVADELPIVIKIRPHHVKLHRRSMVLWTLNKSDIWKLLTFPGFWRSAQFGAWALPIRNRTKFIIGNHFFSCREEFISKGLNKKKIALTNLNFK